MVLITSASPFQYEVSKDYDNKKARLNPQAYTKMEEDSKIHQVYLRETQLNINVLIENLITDSKCVYGDMHMLELYNGTHQGIRFCRKDRT